MLLKRKGSPGLLLRQLRASWSPPEQRAGHGHAAPPARRPLHYGQLLSEYIFSMDLSTAEKHALPGACVWGSYEPVFLN